MNSNGRIVIVNSEFLLFVSKTWGINCRAENFCLLQILSGEAWQGQSMKASKAKHDMMKIPSFFFFEGLQNELCQKHEVEITSYQLSRISLLEAWDNILEYCNHFGRCVG